MKLKPLWAGAVAWAGGCDGADEFMKSKALRGAAACCWGAASMKLNDEDWGAAGWAVLGAPKLNRS